MSQSGNSPTPASGATGSRGIRILAFTGLSLLLVVTLVVMDVILLNRNNPARALSPHYYMALGNSLSFGYQPNLDFSAGFADDIYTDLRKASTPLPAHLVTAIVNYACAGETTITMIQGGCVGRFAHHGSYTGAQLRAAVNFLTANQGRVSPVTLEVGANDVLKDWNSVSCSPNASVSADLATMDSDLTQVILPQLVKALATPRGAPAGNLHLLNYYNPFAKACPGSAPFVHLVNDHLQADAAKFRIPVVDVYTAFGGDAQMANHVCDYTWYCSQYHDIHPTNAGYAVIAKTVETALELPGASPLPRIVAPAGAVAFPVAAVWRRLTLA